MEWHPDLYGGAWLLHRYSDVEWGLRSPLLSARRTGGWVKRLEDRQRRLSRFQALFSRALLFLDEPEHGPLRDLLALGFSAEAMAGLRPQIHQLVEDAVIGLPEAGPFDLVSQLAQDIPIRVMSDLLGLPIEPNPALREASDAIAEFIGSPSPSEEIALAAQEATLLLARLFSRPERLEPSGFAARLMKTEPTRSDPLNLTAQLVMLLFAGHETTQALITNSVWAVVSRPTLWQEFVSGRLEAAALVKEVLRLDGPVQMTGRRVKHDMQLDGRSLHSADLVLLHLGRANRDPERFLRPDEFWPQRAEGVGLAFGSGPHMCIGAALTRMEAIAVLEALRTHRPGLRLVPSEVNGAASSRSANPVYSSFKRLMCTTEPATL